MTLIMGRKKSYKKGEFTSSKIRDRILSLFKRYPTKKQNYKQVCNSLGFKDMGLKMQVVEALNKLAKTGALEEVRRGSYALSFNDKTFFATVKNTNKRGVYLQLDGKKELFVSRKSSMFALAGDLVEAVFFNVNKKREGKIIRVVNRKKAFFVGKIDSSSNNNFLIPDDRSVYFDVFIPSKKPSIEYTNKKVLVVVESWSEKQKNPVGFVKKVIGPSKDHNTEIESILFDSGFYTDFSKNTIKESLNISSFITEEDLSDRIDLRNISTFTIDPLDAKDFDDALSVEKINSNLWRVGIHIADVSHYVPEGGAIDKEALKRGTSVYLVDRVIPMLPEVLSNDICSLKPNVDRLSFSVIFDINDSAEVLDYSIKKTIIHSDFRFTYELAQKHIEEKSGLFSKELSFLDKTAKKLRKKRLLSGSIGFESREVKFVLDSENNPVEVILKKSLCTNKLVEEFMLLANKTISKHIINKKGKPPFIYRVHDKPNNDRLKELSYIVKKLGYKLDLNSKNLSKSINFLLESVKNKEEALLIETLAVRCMAKAVYSTNNIGHFGLAFNFYSHFTSPIRRYPDLIVHRILNSFANDSKLLSKDLLDSICNHCSEQEKNATSAERESIKYMQVNFLKNNIGSIYSGVISGVTDWGIYVEITENMCEGLVKVSSMKDDHFVFNQKNQCLEGFQTKKTYQIGQKVKIKIVSADLEKKQLDFILV